MIDKFKELILQKSKFKEYSVLREGNNFDFLRLYLALAVLWHHFHYLIGEKSIDTIFNIFNPETAVRSFFVISGALIWQSAKQTPSATSFFLKRFFRIFPAYVAVLLLSSLISLILFDADYNSVFKYLGWNLTTLNFIQPCIEQVFVNHITCAQNGSLWTIKVELLYYFFVLIIFYHLNKIANKVYFFTAVLSFFLHYIFIYKDVFYIPPKLINQIPFLLFYFYLGSLLNGLYLKLKPSYNAALFLFISSLYCVSDIFYPLFVVSFVFFIAYALPFNLNVNRFADTSYGVYIYHFPIIQIFIELGVYNYFSTTTSAFLTILVVVFISYFSWHFVEKPSLNFSKKLNNLFKG
ncbi:acyltransferase family protein [Shewanella sp. Koi 1]